MGLFATLDVAAAGLDVQQVRLQVVASNLANAGTTRAADGTTFRPLAATVRSFTSTMQDVSSVTGPLSVLPRPAVVGFEAVDLPPRKVLNPGHPDADAEGFVTLPGSDPVGWTTDLISISRQYEANLRAFDMTRSLIAKTLELGGNR